jgi:hypothetical protein
MKLMLSLVLLLFVTTTAFAEEELRAPPTLRDAAKAHFHDGLAFYRSEQYGPAIVEFRASWELSGERDLLSNLSWACERAGRIPEAKEYAAKYRDLSRGTEDAERSERRVKFLTERYPDGKPGDAKPAESSAAGCQASPVSLSAHRPSRSKRRCDAIERPDASRQTARDRPRRGWRGNAGAGDRAWGRSLRDVGRSGPSRDVLRPMGQPQHHLSCAYHLRRREWCHRSQLARRWPVSDAEETLEGGT